MEGTGTVGYPTERRRSLNNFSTKRTVEDTFLGHAGSQECKKYVNMKVTQF